MAPLSFIVPLRASGFQETQMLLDNGFITNTITTMMMMIIINNNNNNSSTWIKFHASSLPISLQLSCCPPFVRSCLSFMSFIQFISSMHVFDECLSCHSFMDLSISSLTHSPNHPIIPSSCQSIYHSFIHACSMPWLIYLSITPSLISSFIHYVIHWFNRFGDYYSSLCIMSHE